MRSFGIGLAAVAGLVGILVAFSGNTAASQGNPEVGRYQLVASSHTGVSSIYRIDTATGEVNLCYIRGERADGYRVQCSRSDRE